MNPRRQGILFISVRRADPLALAHRILTHVRTTGEQRARVAQRFLPVQQTCYASVPVRDNAVGNGGGGL